MHQRLQIYKTRENFNHLMYRDNVKQFEKQKRTGDFGTNIKNIQPEYRKEIWYFKMH